MLTPIYEMKRPWYIIESVPNRNEIELGVIIANFRNSRNGEGGSVRWPLGSEMKMYASRSMKYRNLKRLADVNKCQVAMGITRGASVVTVASASAVKQCRRSINRRQCGCESEASLNRLLTSGFKTLTRRRAIDITWHRTLLRRFWGWLEKHKLTHDSK